MTRTRTHIVLAGPAASVDPDQYLSLLGLKQATDAFPWPWSYPLTTWKPQIASRPPKRSLGGKKDLASAVSVEKAS